ncbi:MAG: response regulator transcription factor [Propionibacteriaceae bacterium]|nr:response regulator transcription factor [Propionibacteriaceae bacterium]
MVKWHVYWYDLLLVVGLGATAALLPTHPPTQWWILVVALLVFLTGYLMLRPRFSLTFGLTPIMIDYIGSSLMVIAMVIGVSATSIASLMLAIACPVVWNAVKTLRSGIIWNAVMIVLAAAAIASQSYASGTLGRDWPVITGAMVFIFVFSFMIGSMVHAAMRWGHERSELLDELQASQADLAESYQRLISASTPVPVTDSPLSGRETEVLALVSQGYTNRDIAHRLFISPATVKTHMEHILAKLGATTRTQAVLMAHHEGLLSRSEGEV